jgi:hypothetical protein
MEHEDPLPSVLAESTPRITVTPGIKWLVRLALFTTIMPYVGLGMLPSDTQPFAFLFCGMGVALLLLTAEFRLNATSIAAWFMAGLGMLSLALQLATGGPGAFKLLRSYFGYVSAPLVLMFFVYYLRFLRSAEIAKVVDAAVWLTFIGFALNLLGLSSIIHVVVSRAVFEGIGDRGFASFFSEQSTVSIQMAFCFFVYLLSGTLTRKRVAFLVVAALISAAGQVFITGAEVAIAYATAAAGVLLARAWVARAAVRRLSTVFAAILVFVAFSKPITNALIDAGFPGRGLSAIERLVSVGPAYIAHDHVIAIKIASVLHAGATVVDHPTNFRLDATDYSEFRGTISNAYGRIALALFGTRQLIWPQRPYTALGTWIIDFGLLGLAAAIVVLVPLFVSALSAPRELQMPLLWACFFLAQNFFVELPLVNPSLWLVAAMVLAAARGGVHADRRPHTTIETPAVNWA